MVHLF
jgi:hypothetical protein